MLDSIYHHDIYDYQTRSIRPHPGYAIYVCSLFGSLTLYRPAAESIPFLHATVGCLYRPFIMAKNEDCVSTMTCQSTSHRRNGNLRGPTKGSAHVKTRVI
jgi:hypothetical protein